MSDIQFELIGDGNPSIYQGPTLYKLDSTGRLRRWLMQLDSDGRYRTLSGLDNGKQATSGWTVPIPASCPTQKDQGEFEVRSQYKHQLDREYHDNPNTVSQPKMIEPMLAKSYDKWPGPGFAQPKLDGIRCIADVNGLWSRQGQQITAVPHIHAALAPLFEEYPDLVLDGELYNHDLREDFGAISSIVRKKSPTPEQLELAERVMQYHVYDTVDANSTFAARTQFVDYVLAKLDCGWIIPVDTLYCIDERVSDEAYGAFCAEGYEGGMYRLDKTYELGRRSKALLKRKEFLTREFPLLRLEEGLGNWSGAVKRAVLRNDDGKEFGAGIRGSYAAGVALMGADITDKSTATVRYFMLSPDGVPRFPVVIDYQPEGRMD